MKNVVVLALVASLVGCASTSDVKNLQARVAINESKVATLEQDHADIASEHAKLESEVQDVNSKINGLEQKFDRAFKKTMTK